MLGIRDVGWNFVGRSTVQATIGVVRSQFKKDDFFRIPVMCCVINGLIQAGGKRTPTSWKIEDRRTIITTTETIIRVPPEIFFYDTIDLLNTVLQLPRHPFIEECRRGAVEVIDSIYGGRQTEELSIDSHRHICRVSE
jgi:hypothetical protein